MLLIYIVHPSPFVVVGSLRRPRLYPPGREGDVYEHIFFPFLRKTMFSRYPCLPWLTTPLLLAFLIVLSLAFFLFFTIFFAISALLAGRFAPSSFPPYLASQHHPLIPLTTSLQSEQDLWLSPFPMFHTLATSNTYLLFFFLPTVFGQLVISSLRQIRARPPFVPPLRYPGRVVVVG